MYFSEFLNCFPAPIYLDYLQEPQAQAKQEIIEIVQQTPLGPELSPHDKKLFESS